MIVAAAYEGPPYNAPTQSPTMAAIPITTTPSGVGCVNCINPSARSLGGSGGGLGSGVTILAVLGVIAIGLSFMGRKKK